MEVSSRSKSHHRTQLYFPKRLFISVCFLMMLIATPLFGQSAQTVVARVGKQEITQQELDDSVFFKILPLEQQLYALRKVALQNLIIRKLLESEATKKGVTVDQLRREFMAGPVTVPENQVDDLYRQNLNVFALFSPDEAKEKLRLDLEGQTRLKRYRDAISSLRKSYAVEVLLSEPRWTLLYDSSTSFKGPADARVVITEFADFQCGYCKKVQPTLKQLLQIFPNDIQLNFRTLASPTHPMSLASAEAARCAGKQGTFWEFHDALFMASSLSSETFAKLARDFKLNVGEFEQCLSSGEMRSGIDADLTEAQRLGINATPTFLINGRLLTGAASLQEFKAVVEQELNRTQTGSAN